MAGSISLPQVVLDLEEEDRKTYEALKAPTSMVVRYGEMRMIAELPYDGEAKPGCGSKLVIRTARGIELATMLTSTCPNAGCGHAVSRKQMLQYIDNSGGKDYPFTTQGRILRVATVDDLNEQNRLDSQKQSVIKRTRELVAELRLPMKLVDVEMLLGGERILFHYTSEDWVDFRELVKVLASEYHTRIEMHQVNARDEARISADYEKCGQHCCCRQFLKVLKPVSMRSAKTQKATLDPTKISGRCGRLMCCLRYEDTTYEDLRKRLPPRKSRAMTEDGAGTVIETQILTQLVLIELDKVGTKRQAYPLENITILKKGDEGFERPVVEPYVRGGRSGGPGRDAGRDRGPRSGGPGGPSGSGGPGGSGRDDAQDQGQDRQQGERQVQDQGQPQERGSDRNRPEGNRPRSERRSNQSAPAGEPGIATNTDETGENRGDRSQPPRREPRRPSPGKPLEQSEIELREGESLDDVLSGDQGSGSDSGPDVAGGADSDPDHPSDATNEAGDTTAEGGEPGSGQRRRRRRRRRRRGGGGGGGNPAGGPEGDAGPSGSPAS